MRKDIASAAVLTLLAAPDAAAYCPTFTCEFDDRHPCEIDPESGCAQGGAITRWAGECITFAVQADGSPAQSISAETLRQVVEEGFATWSSVECEGRGPGVMTPEFAAAYRGTTRCDAVEYNCSAEYNDNVVMFRDGESSLEANTIALSSIIANLVTGELVDVDIELNSRDYDFSIDPDAIRAGARDLRVVVNHELGHLLGLSHSFDDNALMNFDYAGTNPVPTRDDARGICNTYPVSDAEFECSAPPIVGGGSCMGSLFGCRAIVQPTPAPECAYRAPDAPSRAGRSGTLGGLLALLGLGVWRRQRGRA
ncbi:MAG TPA: matrixin family metalloprotease [Polyangiaceae bacterium]|nr:matrixin family metalloprotease [Polyangiaceae bacterium]